MLHYYLPRFFKSPPTRVVYVNPTSQQTGTHKWYDGNAIHTTKYSWYSFLFKNLFEQFAYRHTNIYFGLIAILCLIPGVSPIGTYGTLLTLSVVVIIQMVKDLAEDMIKVYS